MAKTQHDLVDEIRAVFLALQVSLDVKQQHASFFEAQADVIESFTTVAQFQSIICRYCDFLNVSLFAHLIEELGDADIKAKFELYIHQLSKFRASTKIIDYIDAQAMRKVKYTLPPEFVECNIKLGVSWEDLTLKDVENFLCDLCKEASLAPYAVHSMCAKQNSIILVWGVARSAVFRLLRVLDSKGLERYDLQAVTCDATAAGNCDATPDAKFFEETDQLNATAPSDRADPTSSVTVDPPDTKTSSSYCTDPMKLAPSAGKSHLCSATWKFAPCAWIYSGTSINRHSK